MGKRKVLEIVNLTRNFIDKSDNMNEREITKL